jgi:dTDP-4-dehydrorhamnose 3,5-epimerase
VKIIETELKDAFIIEPDVFSDNRGWFMETYSKINFKKNIEFVQDNHSFSKGKGIIRGLHCQINPHCQSKLIRCVKGEIVDVIVDIRQGSPTYKKHIKVLLNETNKKQLFIPKGFLHGFLTLTDNVEIQYKVDDYYSKKCDRSISYNDKDININWEIDNPILSEKDLKAPLLKDSDCIFVYGETI